MVPDKGSPIHINVSQNDDKCRTFIFKLYSSDGSWTAPASATATIEGRKDDEKFFSFACTYSNGEVTVIVQQQMVAVAGKVRCKIKLVSGAETIESAPFYFVVNPKSIPVNADMSKSDVVDAVAKATQKIVDQVAGSIPQDYVKLNEDVSGLKGDLDDYKNRIITGKIIAGEYIDDNDGTSKTYSGTQRTDYIYVGDLYKIGIYTPNVTPYYAYYDENKNYIPSIKRHSLSAGYNEYIIPDNAVYLRFSGFISDIDGFYIKKGITKDEQKIIEFTEYEKTVITGRLIVNSLVENGVIKDYSGYMRTDYIYIGNLSSVIMKLTSKTNYSAYYDSDKNYIRNIGEQVVGEKEYSIPANAVYMIVSAENSVMNQFVCKYGKNKDVSEVENKFVEYIENVLDPITITENAYIYDGGAGTSPADGYWVSPFISVEGTNVIAISGVRAMAYYDEKRQVISGTYSQLDQRYNVVLEVPNNASYIRFDNNSDRINKDRCMVLTNTSLLLDYYLPYGEKVTPKIKDKFHNKKILWIGTSIPAGNAVANPFGYPKVIGNEIGVEVVNNSYPASKMRDDVVGTITTVLGAIEFCQSYYKKLTKIDTSKIGYYFNTSYNYILDPYITGDFYYPTSDTDIDTTKTYYIPTNTDEMSVVSNPSVSDIRKYFEYKKTDKADLIVLNHGFNDLYADETYDENNYDVSTFVGAMNWTIKRIFSNNPKAKVVIFGHYQKMKNSFDMDKLMSDIAESWEIPYFPLWKELGWSDKNITTTKRIKSDGESPTRKGKEWYSRWVDCEQTELSIKNMWIYDEVHPQGEARDEIARVSLDFIKKNL